MVTSTFIARTVVPVDPPEMKSGTEEGVLGIKTHFEYSLLHEFWAKVYAILDRG